MALLDVVGKEEWLQKLAEDQLPESQCGFRKGQGCTDMIFTVRQLVEKLWEHTAKSFLTFIDLHTAYDSVPWEALWIALRKLGVSEEVVRLAPNCRVQRISSEGVILNFCSTRCKYS